MEDGNFEVILILLVYASPILLILLGLVVGFMLEKKHFKSIREREAATGGFPAVPTPDFDTTRRVAETQLVVSGVVISLDYFKRVLASLRNLVGGRVQAYESLLDRARREAILRLKEQVPDHDIIVNLRIDTSNISSVQSAKKSAIGAIEVLATGTAVRYE